MPNDRPRGLPTVGEGCTTILGPGKSSVRQARELVRKRLAEYGLQDLVDIAELLVSELATNAVVHAGGRYRLTLSLGTGTLRCEVADERPLLPLPPHRQTGSDDHLDVDPDSENGRGLLLVDALAHRWGSRLVDDGKEVWFELELGTPEGTGETAEDVHLPAPARSRAPEPHGRTEAHGRTESHHERTDHGYSPDGDHTEILRPLGMVASMWAPGARRSGTSGLRAPSRSAAAIRPTPRRATSRYRCTVSRGRVVRLRPRAASREPRAALPSAAFPSAPPVIGTVSA
ncbi:ATP-binding protein [Streptomyces sp. NPDC126522]|uniref:ATP-binding protein n=1 Tax=Streptomyces sp. NPDC126522 TaxID=3155211 RepID=UPI00331B239E